MPILRSPGANQESVAWDMVRRGESSVAVVDAAGRFLGLRRRALDSAAGADPDPDALRELGERPERHIRFEERVLFPMIEGALPGDELERLGAALARADADSE